jgi:hypothetical protein
MECSHLAEENARLRQELVALREWINVRTKMKHRDNAYWKETGPNQEEGPFCPKCLDGNDRPVRMAEESDDPWWRCPVCAYVIKRPGWHIPRNAEAEFDPFAS